jgi:SAM-dependent methyltransferase
MASLFYDLHAAAFSKSRFRIWPHVAEFLTALPQGANVLDLGCGNGKNTQYGLELGLQMRGLENSAALCEICVGRGLPVIQGDARALPFEDNTFDAIIMIAVIHHINPEEHRAVLGEIARTLKPGGKALITNWAVEQPEPAWKAPPPRSFAPGLNMVIWKGKEAAPLPYWIMNKTIADEFIQNLPPPLKALDLTWSAGNWEFWLQKAAPQSITSEPQDARPAV